MIQQILLNNFIVPAMVFGMAVLLCIKGAPQINLVQRLCLATGAALAVILAYGLGTGFTLWSEDEWQRIPVGSSLIALATALTPVSCEPRKWANSAIGKLILLAAVLLACFMIIPRGEAWKEIESQTLGWYVAITVGIVVTHTVAERLPSTPLAIFGFVLILWTMASAYLCSESFIKVTLPIIAVATVVGLASLAGLLKSGWRVLLVALPPMLFLVGGGLMHASFYVPPDQLITDYRIAASAPTLLAAVAFSVLGIRRRHQREISAN
jgi:hypothetical protein